MATCLLISPQKAQIVLRVNDNVILEGEMKPSELKVGRLTCAGNTVLIDHKRIAHRT
jgi:hypothetical protein